MMKNQKVYCVATGDEATLTVTVTGINQTTFKEEGIVMFPCSSGVSVETRVEKFPSSEVWQTINESKR